MAWKSLVRKLLGRQDVELQRVGLDSLQQDWTFHSSRPDALGRIFRILARFHRSKMPDWRTIQAIHSRQRWIVYFIYLPTGILDEAHRFTLERLRAADAGLAIVCATPDPSIMPDKLREVADALYWKNLGGFDFSAYSIALGEIARSSPDADVLVMNDSTFGPFIPVDQLWSAMKWDLTGLTASGQVQNHIQSYAFMLREWNAEKLDALKQILPQNWAFDYYRHVVFAQETRLAAIASRSMSVGALWYANADKCLDPSIFAALPLLEAGFPFLKRALLNKHAHYAERTAVIDMLRRQGHPILST